MMSKELIMQKKNLSPKAAHFAMLFVLSATVALFNQPLSAQMIYKIDGVVLNTNEAESLLFVEFVHPVSGEVSEKKFVVSDSAGFKHVKNLGKLQKGDLVSVDYFEEKEGMIAIYVDHIPVKEIAMATPGEVAKTLFKLNSRSKS